MINELVLGLFDLWSARDMLETNPKSHPDQFSARLTGAHLSAVDRMHNLR